jgi:hypothetical protein
MLFSDFSSFVSFQGAGVMRSMSAALCICVFLGSCLAEGLSAEGPQFPYKAHIAVDEAYIRSGPGSTFYPTDKLAKGAEVEVYRHDSGGWCAIRPPQGSYTWVDARFVQPQKDRLGVITQQGVAARVGTRFSDLRDVIHIRLDQGEPVEIIENNYRDETGSVWCKIAPPSGEFRWVAAKDLDTEQPRERPRRQDAVGDGFVAKGTSGKDISARPMAEPGDRVRPNESAAGVEKLSPQEHKAELDHIELALSMMIVEEPTVWSFDSLRARADALLDRADSAVQRGQVRLLLGKIDRFEDIKNRYSALTAQRNETKGSDRFLGRLGRTMREAREYVDTQSDQYDGQGVLQPVRSDKPGDPQYALVDSGGKVRYYVSPAPGVNLYSYVGRPIGVTGTRGYMTDQKVQYIMARHVIPLTAGGPMLR